MGEGGEKKRGKKRRNGKKIIKEGGIFRKGEETTKMERARTVLSKLKQLRRTKKIEKIVSK